MFMVTIALENVLLTGHILLKKLGLRKYIIQSHHTGINQFDHLSYSSLNMSICL
jgi:hypothetical protein